MFHPLPSSSIRHRTSNAPRGGPARALNDDQIQAALLRQLQHSQAKMIGSPIVPIPVQAPSEYQILVERERNAEVRNWIEAWRVKRKHEIADAVQQELAKQLHDREEARMIAALRYVTGAFV